MKKTEKNNNAVTLMELGALMNAYVMLKNVGGAFATETALIAIIDKKLAQVK